MQNLAAILFTIAIGLLASGLVKPVKINSYAAICKMVFTQIYLENEKIQSWYESCLKEADLYSSYQFSSQRNSPKIIKLINNKLDELGVSHLQIYEKSEVKSVWNGVSKKTGIKSKWIEGKLIIVGLDQGSSSEKSGLGIGDIVLKFNNQETNENQIANESGEILVKRKNSTLKFSLQATEYVRNEDMVVADLTEGAGLLKVPTFRSEYFDYDHLEGVVAKMQKYERIVVDLRGNGGGNFISGLRLLGILLCGEQPIGFLRKDRNKNIIQGELQDSLEDNNQLAVMDRFSLIQLKSILRGSCLAKKIAVLVDNETSSTAEMVAQALKDYSGVPVFGIPTSGALLVGVWYQIPGMPEGNQISIPEMSYQTQRGRVIEGQGVQLHSVRPRDEVHLYQTGLDPWTMQVLELF